MMLSLQKHGLFLFCVLLLISFALCSEAPILPVQGGSTIKARMEYLENLVKSEESCCKKLEEKMKFIKENVASMEKKYLSGLCVDWKPFEAKNSWSCQVTFKEKRPEVPKVMVSILGKDKHRFLVGSDTVYELNNKGFKIIVKDSLKGGYEGLSFKSKLWSVEWVAIYP